MRRFLLIIFACLCIAACATPDGGDRWRLVYEESFETAFSDADVPWVVDPHGVASPWDAGFFDDDGPFFDAIGGQSFQRQLASFQTLRKRIAFGTDGWLTLEMAGRDSDKDGVPDAAPSFTTARLAYGRTVGRMIVPSHDGGVLIRGTAALPARYRIEVTLVALDFGGSRAGQWNRDGLINGYAAAGVKTPHPWAWAAGGDFARPYEQWPDVRIANGFYFLAIVDYANPAPHNNIFLHAHRKVAIDTYNIPDSSAQFRVCNPADGSFYVSQDNAVNALFISETNAAKLGRRFDAIAVTAGGTFVSGEANDVVAAAQLMPELMPKQTYRFAIERDATGYTLEFSGPFRHVGETTLRYRRDFVQDGRAIWHYNQTPDEYDGAHDRSFTVHGPFGRHTIEHTWPAGSAYPDYFIVGDPFTNYYEGHAAIDDIRLYVPSR